MRPNRDFGLRGVGAGKGDADRSPGWRDNYNAVEMPHVPARDDATFSPVPGRPGAYRKTYGKTAPVEPEFQGACVPGPEDF